MKRAHTAHMCIEWGKRVKRHAVGCVLRQLGAYKANEWNATAYIKVYLFFFFRRRVAELVDSQFREISGTERPSRHLLLPEQTRRKRGFRVSTLPTFALLSWSYYIRSRKTKKKKKIHVARKNVLLLLALPIYWSLTFLRWIRKCLSVHRRSVLCYFITHIHLSKESKHSFILLVIPTVL